MIKGKELIELRNKIVELKQKRGSLEIENIRLGDELRRLEFLLWKKEQELKP